MTSMVACLSALGSPIAPVLTCAAPVPAPKAVPAQEPSSGVRVFAPGIRIDWRRGRVEVDGKVVLRRGPLELLACSPNTKEHESILAVGARPMQIFQAMGLIGLQPGAPAHYDPKTDRWWAPRGEALALKIRFERGGTVHVVPADRWLRLVKTHRPPEHMEWVFSGSRTFKGGAFGADVEGTVACVVDFETALISIGALHTADNDQLWLEANTDAIAPLDTACTLLISRDETRTIVIDVTADGKLKRDGVIVSPVKLARSTVDGSAGRGGKRLVLRAGADVPKSVVKATVAALVKAGVASASIQVRQDAQETDKASSRPASGGS